MISQVIDRSKIVQTELTVDVGNIRVDYTRLVDTFGYAFWVVIGITEDEEAAVKEADTAIDTIIETMCAQSYDHGSEWRLVRKEVNTDLLDRYGLYRVTAYFRVKDSY